MSVSLRQWSITKFWNSCCYELAQQEVLSSTYEEGSTTTEFEEILPKTRVCNTDEIHTVRDLRGRRALNQRQNQLSMIAIAVGEQEI